ncbi:MAG: hypothetical protein JST48_03845 [Bacteroidetes bacterium]|nr:hypothetical protein [Bacteroidota bacterium]
MRTSIHKIVDSIESEQLLKTIYDFLKVREKSSSRRVWDFLTEEQKNEVISAFDESEDENNLVDPKTVFQKD